MCNKSRQGGAEVLNVTVSRFPACLSGESGAEEGEQAGYGFLHIRPCRDQEPNQAGKRIAPGSGSVTLSSILQFRFEGGCIRMKGCSCQDAGSESARIERHGHAGAGKRIDKAPRIAGGQGTVAHVALAAQSHPRRRDRH